MTRLLPLDLHAHLAPDIDAQKVDDLRAVVFAAMRSLEESDQALQRDDPYVVWGVGCHPGLVGAHKSFTKRRFADLIANTAYIAELGLDGDSRVPLEQQTETLRSAFAALATAPRIVSLHSYRAAELLIAELERSSVSGVILHWWLGDRSLTQRALQLGCYFSVNVSSVRQRTVLDALPLDRLFTETDHPFGDRFARQPRQPGNVSEVEELLAAHHGVTSSEVRRTLWHNLGDLVRDVGCGRLLPRSVRASLAALGSR